jgi:hypothetical protein
LSRRVLVGLCAATVVVSALGCGGSEEERTFSAAEFVEAVNAEGVELRLGEPLVTDDEDSELYAVELKSVSSLPGAEGGSRVEGSLSVSPDGSGADEEIASCEQAADLLCYRVANVVVVLEGGGIEAQQLAVAARRLAEE